MSRHRPRTAVGQVATLLGIALAGAVAIEGFAFWVEPTRSNWWQAGTDIRVFLALACGVGLALIHVTKPRT